MASSRSMCTFREAKDLLMSAADKKPGGKVPNGAQQNVWMCLMTVPKNNYNEVYPKILLGDSKYASDPEKLKEFGVTHVVNCACGKKFNKVDTSQEFFDKSGIRFHGIGATDILTFKMAPHFDAAVAFMKEALDSGGKIYVHCISGVSRSATIVLAYLMLVKNMPLMDALKLLREHRKIMPNDGFVKELVELNNKLLCCETSEKS